MSKDKIFYGNGKIAETKFGMLPKISLHKDHVNNIVKWMKENKSDWINLDLKEKKEKKEGKPTHYLDINTWKPEKKDEVLTPKDKENIDNFNDVDDLPF